jgi:feruloyl esterase
MKRCEILFAVLTGLSLGFGTSARAQNMLSFSEISEASVDLSATRFEAVMHCRKLRALTDFNITVVDAQLMAAKNQVPAHCRVDGVIRPEITFQINLPSSWNGRLYMYGNRGYAGGQPDSAAPAALRDEALTHTFATAFTDTGHNSDAMPLGTFAFNSLSQEIDHAFRAVHLTAETAKRLIEAYYGKAEDYAYWDGCSTGGRQGLMSAQRFPLDFDGIIVGSPILDFTGTQIAGVWNELALMNAEPRLSMQHLDLIVDVVYEQCDALDGLEDGLIADPRACSFDPLDDLPACTKNPDATCFTKSQREALARVYGGVISNGEHYFPGQPVGAEAKGVSYFATEPVSGWAEWLLASSGGPSRQGVMGRTFLENLAFDTDRADYDWTQFDFDRDPQRVARAGSMLNADDPDLGDFAQAGGRMIGYFGWADAALNAMMMVDYYDKVLAGSGDEAKEYFRLFLVPGMFHCRGGIGPDHFDAMRYLVDWVELGKAPDRIVATEIRSGRVQRSRPLCPYPQVARYDGSGDEDNAAAFKCTSP